MVPHILLVVALIALKSTEGKLPSYITPCNLNKIDLVEKCVKNNLEQVRPHFKEGIKELHLPVLVPLHLPEVSIEATDSLNIKLMNLDIFNFDHVEIKKVEVAYNPPNVITKFSLFFDQIIVLGQYDVNGKILILPIQGHGPANITVDNFAMDYTFTAQPKPRKGRDYMAFSDQHFDYTMSRLYLKLENLFNGDKGLADQVNQFLDENWKDVLEVLRPALSKTIMTIVADIFTVVGSTTPMDEFFDLSK